MQKEIVKFKNSFLDTYLRYVEDTESPRIFHIWSALSGVAACLGRRVTFPFGICDLFANHYILLVGPPGGRKSTAINIMSKLVRNATAIRFAPSDTAGQRQGLIIAMEGINGSEDGGLIDELDAAIAAADLETIANIEMRIDPRDSHTMYICASEFNSFIGTNASEMITFLGKMYDGENYDYKLKNTQNILIDPLLNMLGGTTPTNIASAFPPEAIGQGFMSRVILVFGSRKFKKIPWPKPLDKDLAKKLSETYHWLYYELDGEITVANEARDLLTTMYDEEIELNDPRFVYYCERRHIHLLKLTMLLAVARRDIVVSLQDVKEEQSILQLTEKFMPDALGEYGMSPLAAAKQKLVEFLQHAKGPVGSHILWALLQRDMKAVDFRNTLSDLVNANKIQEVRIKSQTDENQTVQAFVYKDEKQTEVEEALKAMME